MRNRKRPPLRLVPNPPQLFDRNPATMPSPFAPTVIPSADPARITGDAIDCAGCGGIAFRGPSGAYACEDGCE